MDEAVIKRIQPNSIEAEQSVIGSMLMDRDAIVEAADILKKEDFYHGEYGLLFEAMITLYNEGKPVDLLTVSNKLKEMGAPASISNMEYAADLLSQVPTSAHARQYAQIVQDKSTLRRMLRFTEKTTESCYAGSMDVAALLEESEKELFDIVQKRGSGDQFRLMQDLVLDVLDTIEESAKRGSKITGVPTGFIDLDEKLTGLHGSELILIAARPSMGKTAFALNIAQNAAMKYDVPCAVFSLEMSSEQMVSRLIAMDSMIDSQAIRTGQLADSDWDKLMDSTQRVGGMPMFIDDTPGITIAELRSKCRRLKQKQNIGLIIIDYLQLMNGSGRSESRQQEISEISRSLKKLARELDVPIVALSQLNRAVDSREDHKPVMSDLRESGAIEQDADVIMFIYRDDYYNKESTKPGIADIIVAKQRNGSTGPVELVWLGKYTKFANKEKSGKR
ncbi:MAG: replicative DNA helicase [Lachnospiraceae bacterium]|nr:replicative DNA helicase [Lachnospiraceae bacterium]MDE6626634.1 replicative DNA helicase [Lachnospiraceae bacterium]